MQLVLNSLGLRLKVRNACFWIKNGEEERLIGPARVSSILVTHNCLLSSAALMLAVQYQIPVHFISYANGQSATIYSAAYTQKTALRQAQIALAFNPAGTKLIADCLHLKTGGMVLHLQALAQKNRLPVADANQAIASMRQSLKSMDSLLNQPLHECANQLMGIEGAITAQYWPLAGACLPAPFNFIKRGRRPAPDPGNAVLNYANSLLYALTERAIHAAGLDAWLGLLHKARPGRPTLVYDCIEPFRPWVNEWLCDALHQKLLKPEWVQQMGSKAPTPYWIISKEGRSAIIAGFNHYFFQVITWQGHKQSRHDHVFAWCSALAKNMMAAAMPGETENPSKT